MWIAVLFLVLLLIAGLMGTANFPIKKLLAWFQSFYVKFHASPSGNPSCSAGNYMKIPCADDDQQATRKTASTSCGNKLQLKSIFATFDKNSDGYITKQELRDSLNNIGMAMSDRDIADMVKRVDSNRDGLIDLDEFCESFESLLGRGGMREEEERGKDGNNEDDEEDLKEAFDVFDGDKDGVITVEELGMVLSSLGFKEGNKLESCKEMIRKVDMDGDGMVNFHEFKLMMKAGQRLVPVS